MSQQIVAPITHDWMINGHCNAYIGRGAFDSDSQRVLDARKQLLARLRTKEPEAHVTYFPVEEEYHIHVWGRSLSGYHRSYGTALLAAHDKLFPDTLTGNEA